MTPTFRKRLLRGDLLVGTILSLPSPAIAELLARSGFDYLFIDGEHGCLSVGDIQLLLQAAQPHCPCLVRVAANEEVHVKRALDTGADAIVVPSVNDDEAAARTVAWARYPPLGQRSVGIARAHGYGGTFAEYLSRANETVAVIVQVEHHKAVANIDAILQVAGIDAIFIGPYDLSASMGIPGRVDDTDVQQQMAIVRQACLRRRMPLGVFGAHATAVKPFIIQGYRLIAVGSDTLMLGQEARRVRSAVQALTLPPAD